MLFDFLLPMAVAAIVVRGLPSDLGIQHPLDLGELLPERQHHVPTKEGWIDPRINGGQFLDVSFLSNLAPADRNGYKYLISIVHN